MRSARALIRASLGALPRCFHNELLALERRHFGFVTLGIGYVTRALLPSRSPIRAGVNCLLLSAHKIKLKTCTSPHNPTARLLPIFTKPMASSLKSNQEIQIVLYSRPQSVESESLKRVLRQNGYKFVEQDGGRAGESQRHGGLPIHALAEPSFVQMLF